MKSRLATLIFAATLLMLAACDPTETPQPTNPVQTADTQRTVIYSVAGDEVRRTLSTEAEWDVLLDRFCDYAQQGNHVAFYSMAAQSVQANTKGSAADRTPVSFSTTNRDEMKQWMKKMEKEGRTVTVTYNEPTGTWSGVATATAPQAQQRADCYEGTLVAVGLPAADTLSPTLAVAALRVSADTVLVLQQEGDFLLFEDVLFFAGIDTGEFLVTMCGSVSTQYDYYGNAYMVLDLSVEPTYSIVGSWQYVGLSITQLQYSNQMQGVVMTTTFVEADAATPTLYDFSADGSLTVSASGTQQSYQWSIDQYGNITCGGMYADATDWAICWLSDSTLILARTETSATGTETIYTMEFQSAQ